MELKELRDKKKKIEQEIAEKIGQFQKETGVKVDGINITSYYYASDGSFGYSVEIKVSI
jgi:hypothetical protein